MSEFNNRIEAQRRILRLVNCSLALQEELFGLSSGALDRWTHVNGLDEHAPLPTLLREAARKLFFLSNKSQEQVTDEYLTLSNEVTCLTEQIRKAITAMNGS